MEYADSDSDSGKSENCDGVDSESIRSPTESVDSYSDSVDSDSESVGVRPESVSEFLESTLVGTLTCVCI